MNLFFLKLHLFIIYLAFFVKFVESFDLGLINLINVQKLVKKYEEVSCSLQEKLLELTRDKAELQVQARYSRFKYSRFKPGTAGSRTPGSSQVQQVQVLQV